MKISIEATAGGDKDKTFETALRRNSFDEAKCRIPQFDAFKNV